MPAVTRELPKTFSREEVHASLIQSLRSFQKKWDDYNKRERARRMEALEAERKDNRDGKP